MSAGQVADRRQQRSGGDDNEAAEFDGHALFEKLQFGTHSGDVGLHGDDFRLRRQFLAGGIGECFGGSLGLLMANPPASRRSTNLSVSNGIVLMSLS